MCKYFIWNCSDGLAEGAKVLELVDSNFGKFHIETLAGHINHALRVRTT